MTFPFQRYIPHPMIYSDFIPARGILGAVECCLLTAFLMGMGPSLSGQDLTISNIEKQGNQLLVEVILNDADPHVQTKLVLERRWSGSANGIPTRMRGKRHLWIRGGKTEVIAIPILPDIAGNKGQNMILHFEPKKTRIHVASRWLTFGLGSAAAISRLQSSRSSEAYLAATEQDEIDAHFKAAQNAHRVSLVTGGLTLGVGLAWKSLAGKLPRYRRGVAGEMAVHPETGRITEMWPASEGSGCVFESSGALPSTVQSARIVAVQEGGGCPNAHIARSKWQNLLTRQFDILARDQALENAILKEQELWLNGIIADEWSRKVGNLAGAQFTLLAHCESRNQHAELRIIDNVKGQEIWHALGEHCPSDRFVDEVKLRIRTD